MKWLLDFFLLQSWRELFAMSVLAAVGFIAFWALIFMSIILFG
jgi:hypothetical protein